MDIESIIEQILVRVGLTNILVRNMGNSKGFIVNGYNVIDYIVGDEEHSLILSIQEKDLISLSAKFLNEQIETINKKVKEHLLGFVLLIGRNFVREFKKSGSNSTLLKPVLITSKRFKCVDSEYKNFIIKSDEAKFQLKFS